MEMSENWDKKTEEFIRAARQVHGNKYYYTKVKYKSARQKVEVVCLKHGSFFVTPNNHISKKSGCPKCGVGRMRSTTEDFIRRAREVHGDKYDYSESVYTNTRTKLKIICPKHGEFYQTPKIHLQGKGCKRCAHRYQTTEDIVEQLREIHGDKYDYSEFEYKGTMQRAKVICPIHGAWFPIVNTHLYGKCGCPECGKRNNYTENEFGEWLASVYSGEIRKNDRTVLWDEQTRAYKEIDFFLPELRLAIEFNGEYWHDKRERDNPGYHKRKQELCEQHGLRLINVSFGEWKENRGRVEEAVLISINNTQ